MKITLLESASANLTPIEQVLVNRGIAQEEISHYLNLDDTVVQDYSKLDNIEEGVDLLQKHLAHGSRILIQVDSDVDGYTSSALLYNFIDANYPQAFMEFQVHEDKSHGIKITDEIKNNLYDLIIVPDASSNEFEKHKFLRDLGVDVLVIDHHEAPYYSNDAVVINNQLSQNYVNKELSAVGVVWQFCRALEDTLSTVTRPADEFLDLVALGNVSDMMDLRSHETRRLVTKGLEQINTKPETGSKLLQAAVRKQSFSLGDKVTPIGMAFYIAPMINAVVRVGTLEEREMVFKAFIDSIAGKDVPSTKRGAKSGDTEIRAEQAVRVMGNIRNRQKREEQKGIEAFGASINEEYLNSNSLVVLNTQGKVPRELNGLIANQMQSKYKRPSLVVQEKDGYIEGSGRGHETSILTDFREFIQNSKLAEFAEGHANAFGVRFTKSNFDKFIAYANSQLDYGKAEKEYEVDFMFDQSNFEESIFFEIDKYGHLWGVGVDEPLICLRDITITENNFDIMRNNTLKITAYGKVPCIKFRAPDELTEELQPQTYSTRVVDIVGRVNINEFNGNITPQLFIEDINIKEKKLNF